MNQHQDKEAKHSKQKVCLTPGCRQAVAWSQAQNKFANLCSNHLELHRNQCKVSALRKKKELLTYKQLCQTLQEENALLKSNIKTLQSELQHK